MLLYDILTLSESMGIQLLKFTTILTLPPNIILSKSVYGMIVQAVLSALNSYEGGYSYWGL